INTDLPGMVRAVAREDVYSLDGRRILIPKGSRLTGEYRSGIARGQKRVFIVWNRVIRSDGVSVDIASPGADRLGRGGLAGSQRDARSIAFDKSSTALQQLAQEAFRDTQTIPPTIYVDQGTPVVVFVRRDLDFSELYADPVEEELARLKRGGNPAKAIDPTPLLVTPRSEADPYDPGYGTPAK
ncbi:TrbI/VirB10 family protein, partial [Mesorhizobium sp.]|uniref:TrbI/VirB10 family protein n=1 Tax=Mesorhizobium sp. TaxID=1871066 RepID=UPI000FEA4A85